MSGVNVVPPPRADNNVLGTQWQDYFQRVYGALKDTGAAEQGSLSNTTSTGLTVLAPVGGSFGTPPTITMHYYFRVGHLVFYYLNATFSTVGSATGSLIYTVPTASETIMAFNGTGQFALSNPMIFASSAAGSQLFFSEGSPSIAGIDWATITPGSALIISGWYFSQ